MQHREFIKLANLTLFRLSPFLAKRWVYQDNEFRIRESAKPEASHQGHYQLADEQRVFSSGNTVQDLEFLDEMMAFLSADGTKPTFRVFHFTGVHAPFHLDRNLKPIGAQPSTRESYLEQAKGMLKMLDLQMNRLREIGAYDNSLIFILGDHGCGEYNMVGFHGTEAERLGLGFEVTPPSGPLMEQVIRGGNPLVLVKPMNQEGPLAISRSPVELGDIPNTIFKELGFLKAMNGPSMFEVPPTSDRTRLHKHYLFSGWGQDFIVPLTEYEIKGFSWDASSWAPTGRDLNEKAVNSIDGQLVVLGQGGNLDSFPNEGWSAPEIQGRFFQGNSASIRFPIENSSEALTLEIRTRPSLSSSSPTPMKVLINNKHLDTWDISSSMPVTLEAYIPGQVTEGQSTLDVRFELAEEGTRSPYIIEIRLKNNPEVKFYSVGDRISFLGKETDAEYMGMGWAGPEDWGTWTSGSSAKLHFTLDALPARDLEGEIRFRPALFPGAPPMRVDVIANGDTVSKWTLTNTGGQTKTFQVPRYLIKESRRLELNFSVLNPNSPKDYKNVTDSRKLGLGVQDLVIREIEAMPFQPHSDINRNLLLEGPTSVQSSGLHNREIWNGVTVVWTNGAAEFKWPGDAPEMPAALQLSAMAAAFPGSPLAVLVNNELVGFGSLDGFPWKGFVDLTELVSEKLSDVKLYSSVMTPSAIRSDSQDSRQLGVALSLVELMDEPPSYSSSSDSLILLKTPGHIVLDPGYSNQAAWSGVYDTEDWNGRTVTWTKGSALCQVSWEPDQKPRNLLIDIGKASPSGATITIDINGTRVLDNQQVGDNWSKLCDLGMVPYSEQLEIRLTCSTFSPADLSLRSNDNRVLGVALRKLVLIQ